MCSTQCETPVTPGTSLRAPTPYQTQKVVIGALCISRVSIRRPFGRTVSRVPPAPFPAPFPALFKDGVLLTKYS
jgi:hypothetical protein